MFIRSLALAALLFSSTPVFAIGGNCGQPDQAVRDGIVRIQGGHTVGSGIVVEKDRILTAAHVIDELDEIFVRINGKRVPATVVSTQPKLDLALLLAPTGDIQPINLLRGSPRLKDDVWAMGYPLGKALAATSGKFKGSYDKKLYTTASVNYGQSGGGLITCHNGRHVLAGMVKAFGAVMKNGKLERRDDFSVAARSQDIRRFVAGNRQIASVLESFIQPSR